MQLFTWIYTATLFFSSSTSGDKLYTKLEKKYVKNTDRCELIAKKAITKNRKQAEPYYFLAQINYDRFLNSSNLKEQYSYINVALNNAKRLAKLRPAGLLRSSGRIDSLRNQITIRLPQLIDTLEKSDLASKAQRLAVKGERLGWYKRPIQIVKKEEVESDFISDRMFYKMPNGNENVKSANENAEHELVKMLNAARKAKGMKPLVWDENLARAARYHAADMATQNYFDHSSYDRVNGELIKVGGTFPRIRQFYTNGFVNSENIAAGSTSAEGTYRQWYNSPGHNKNMFNPNSKKVGVGVFHDSKSIYGYYWAFCTALD